MKKLYEQSTEMQLSGKCQLRHVKCTHHKGYLMEDLSIIKNGFYEISFCKSGDFLFRIGQKRHFITNGDILVIPPDIPHYFTSSDLVANYYDFITVWLEKSYISNLKSQLLALKESVFNIDTPHLLHTTNKLCNFEEEFETFYREITEDMEKGYKKRGIKVKAGQPANFYCISCVPWAAFTAFGSRTVNSTEPVYFPIITMGKYEKSGDRILMPVNLMIAHAVADGYHAGMFFQRLQEAVDRLSVRNQDPE